MSNSDDRETSVRIRRAPKFGVFLIIGAVLGVLAALIITLVAPTAPNTDAAANTDSAGAFGYLALVGIFVGLFLGSIVALVFDRVLNRRAKTVNITIDHLQPTDDSASTQP